LTKQRKRELLLKFAPYIAYILVHIILFFSKKRFQKPEFTPQKPYIVLMWHGELLLQPYYYNYLRPNNNVAVIASEHNDGLLISKFVSYFGVDTIQGSSTRGGAKALLQAIKLMKSGTDIAITPDGPRGPQYSVANGIIALAQKEDCYIMPHRISMSRKWELNSWDRFMIPKPFGTIDFKVGEPFKITNLSQEEAIQKIKKQMQNV